MTQCVLGPSGVTTEPTMPGGYGSRGSKIVCRMASKSVEQCEYGHECDGRTTVETDRPSGSFRPGPGGTGPLGFAPASHPSFVATHDFLHRYPKYLIYVRFQIVENWANLRFSLNVQKPKVFQLQRGFALLTPSLHRPRWQLCPQTPVIGPRKRARHGAVLSPPPPPRCCGLEPPLDRPRHGKITKWVACARAISSRNCLPVASSTASWVKEESSAVAREARYSLLSFSSCCSTDLQRHPVFISSERAMRFPISDQWQPWSYLLPFSHNISVTKGRTDARQLVPARQK